MGFTLKVKSALTQVLVLTLPDFSKPFVVERDASQGLGVVFFSKVLHGRNLLLSTYEREMLALVLAIQKWKHYLLGRSFIVRTDHASLKYHWEQRITKAVQQK